MVMILESEVRPKYHLIKKDILNKIHRGEFLIGMQIPTEDELMKTYSVSKSTVRRAVSDLVYEGGLIREQGRGTFVADQRPVRTTAQKNIGVVFLNIYNSRHPYLHEILAAVTRESNKQGYNLQILATPAERLNHEENRFLLETISKRRTDGLILASRMPLEDILILKHERIPFVLIGNILLDKEVHFVTTDPFASTYEAVEHLIEIGHRKISMLLSLSDGGARPFTLSAFKHAHRKHGLQINARYIKQAELSRETGRVVMKELLTLPERPTAFMAGDDSVACGAIEAVWEAELKVPDNMAVVGGGNWPLNFSLPLTTIDSRLGDVTRLAIEMLTKMINGQEINESHVILEPRFVVRDSTVGKKK